MIQLCDHQTKIRLMIGFFDPQTAVALAVRRPSASLNKLSTVLCRL